MDCSTPGFPVLHHLLEFAQTHVHPVSDAIPFLHHPLLLLPSIFPSVRVFSNETVLCIRWPKYWSFSFSISPFSEYSGLISWMDWLDLLADPTARRSWICRREDCQESSPTPQFKNINSSVLIFLYGPTLTSVHDYWKSDSFD